VKDVSPNIHLCIALVGKWKNREEDASDCSLLVRRKGGKRLKGLPERYAA